MKRIIFSIIVFVVLTGCAVSKNDIQKINNTLQTQEEKIAHLEELLNNLNVDPETLRDQNNQLNNQIQALNNRISVLESNTGTRRTTAEPPAQRPAITVVESTTPVVTSRSTNIQSTYDEARRFYNLKDYPSAIRGFQSIIEQAPNHDLAANSQYWIGESYYALADFSAARLAFQQVQENYPNSNKFVDSQLKIAMTWIQQNRKDQARSILQAIKRDFPRYENMHLVDQNLRLTQ